MKRIIALACALLVMSCLFGCSKKNKTQGDESKQNESQVTENGGKTESADKSWADVPDYPDTYPTQEDVATAYNAACTAFGWMTLTSAAPLDPEDTYVFDNITYYRVDNKYIQSLSDLELYYKTLFSDDIVDLLMDVNEEIGRFVENPDGGLYSMGFTYKPQGFSEEETFELVKNSEDSYNYNVSYYTVDEDGNKKHDHKEYFKYEKVDGRWIFTNFYVYRQ